jgi:phytoene dehydrogenase-like protein
VNWSLDAPIPWSAEPARRASTVHVAEGIPGLTRSSVQLNEREIPDRPFLILGQCSMADPTRSPQGTETAWAYTHTPQQPLRDAAGEIAGDWSDPAQVEAFAPTSPPPPPTPAAASTAARAATRQRPPCAASAPSASSPYS